jgi:hypothetical protein
MGSGATANHFVIFDKLWRGDKAAGRPKTPFLATITPFHL